MNTNVEKQCSQCDRIVNITVAKYFIVREDILHVFCDAYCSHDWHINNTHDKEQHNRPE